MYEPASATDLDEVRSPAKDELYREDLGANAATIGGLMSRPLGDGRWLFWGRRTTNEMLVSLELIYIYLSIPSFI